MAKIAQKNSKYLVKAHAKASGIVEKADVIGALHGQTEGLLGNDMDLADLRKRGKIGRMNIEVNKENGKSHIDIEIPSSLDAEQTSILAASIETVEKVGPAHTDIRVDEIVDVRKSKRDYIVKRSKQLLNEIKTDKPDIDQIREEIQDEDRQQRVKEYKGFKAGEKAENADEVILVEGEADLKNLLSVGISNVVAIGGTSVPDNIVDIAEDKKATALLDGDRGGDLILKELEQKADIDFVARAPEDTEIEDLSEKQLMRSVRDKDKVGSADQDLEVPEENSAVKEYLTEMIGTRAVHFLNEDLEPVRKAPRDNFDDAIEDIDEIYAVAIDGKITNKKIQKAEDIGSEYFAGMEQGGNASSGELRVVTR
ncbi:MAG: DNA primase [Candidatus Nanohaloarchaea archaeon]|jgi:DNA primase